ncbi:MAG: hypothetical protein IJY74_04340, partial [Oscillospiraceae bacterium]|nr:hypothetical protein [Oscillospiraceae bacterium]
MKKSTATKKIPKNFLRTDGLKLSSILYNVKKLFLPWIIVSVLIMCGIVCANIIVSPDIDTISSTISFNYSGIEKGLDPNGCDFDVNSMKNDTVISQALEASGLSAELLDDVKTSIFIDGMVSSTAINSISSYTSKYDSSYSSWTENIRDSSYTPTQYRVTFKFNKTGLDGNQAADLLNSIIESYQAYFIDTYGYNEAISDSVLSLDFDNYDYLIALDMYDTKLGSLEKYINAIAADDSKQFRCDETGYSFSDISSAVSLIRSVDIDTLTSYIINNGVISDKDMILSYYEYRLDSLERLRTNAKERLASVNESIEIYKKDAVVIYGAGGAGTTSVTDSSDAYDNMVQQKIDLQNTISDYTSYITNFTERIETIKKMSGSASKTHKTYVDERIAALTGRVNTIAEDLKITADDYFENEKVTYAVESISPADY